MDFSFTPQEAQLRQRCRELVERELRPLVAQLDPSSYLASHAIHELFRRTATIGYLGAAVSQANGGSGYSYVELGLLLETLVPVFGFVAAHVVPRQLDKLGADDQRRRFLPPLLTGERLSTILMTEPGTGSDAGSLRMSARREGDHYILNGTKRWVTLGGVATVAGALVSTDPAAGPKGLTRLVLDLEPGAYECRPIPTLGLRRFPLAELRFSNYRVPVANRVGAEGEGLRLTLSGIQASRVSVATQAVGLAQAATDAAIDYAQRRHQFGRPIGAFQLVQGLVAEMLAETEAARFLAYRGWTMLDRGEECSREASLAKLYATESAVRVTSKAIQVHGANGLSEEYPVTQYFRDARMLTFPDGTSEVHKLLVGRAALGLSAFQ